MQERPCGYHRLLYYTHRTKNTSLSTLNNHQFQINQFFETVKRLVLFFSVIGNYVDAKKVDAKEDTQMWLYIESVEFLQLLDSVMRDKRNVGGACLKEADLALRI